MAILEVIETPNPILRKKASVVEMVVDGIRTIMDNMLETMYHDNGVGLAANQVAILKRIIVLDLQKDDEIEREEGFYPIFMANPEITDCSDEMVEGIEGCLSVPDQKISVKRHEWVKVRYLDYNNNIQDLDASGWLARAVQHEIDHLNGKLLIDYLSDVKKDVVMRKLAKMQKHASAN